MIKDTRTDCVQRLENLCHKHNNTRLLSQPSQLKQREKNYCSFNKIHFKRLISIMKKEEKALFTVTTFHP
jgi:hypothetical protein